MIAVVGAQALFAGQAWSLALRATDVDVPAQALTWAVVAAPQGVLLDSASGLLRWTPDLAQAPGDFTISIRVTDNGLPSKSAVLDISLRVSAPAPSPLVETIESLTLLNSSDYLLNADGADNDPTTQRDELRARATVHFAAPDLVTRTAVYRMEFRLVNSRGRRVLLRADGGGTTEAVAVDLSETLPRRLTLLGPLSSSERIDINRALRPATALDPNETYRIEGVLL